MQRLFSLLAVALIAAGCVSMTPAQGDPNAYLEDIHGKDALAWVNAENAKTLRRLEGDPRYATYRAQALAIFTSADRLAFPSFRAGGIDNLWQDNAHKHGLWRHTSTPAFLRGRPAWTTLLDLDALSKAEGRNWFLKGIDCLAPEDRLCLLNLSDGGGDAVEVREFDAASRSFVKGGFQLPKGKQNVEWVDRDTLLVSAITGADDATESGYASTVRLLKRGQSLAEAAIVFRGTKADTMVSPRVLRDADGRLAAMLAERRVGFFDVETHLIEGGKAVRLELPTHASFETFMGGQVIFGLQGKWAGFDAGALIAVDLEAARRDPAHVERHATLVFQPGPSQTVDAVSATRDRVVVQMLDNVKGAVEVFVRSGGRWVSRRLPLPANAQTVIRAAQASGTRIFLTSESFLEPTRLWAADAVTGKVRSVAALPARFKAGTHRVEQLWAVSKDGTRIPYFLVRPKRGGKPGETPTLLFGYGGFLISKPPVYLPEMGRLWLEHGGAFVIANIRGGGEFGPAWHKAALRENRQRAFDDFAAVAEDLISRKVTNPRRLGIYGRSNGGVLTTVSMTQRPDLFNAVVVESPLIDMLRYHKLSAGASWVAEYGNPDVPEDRAFIAAYSAYQNLKPGVRYPEPYITTNTEDDRVHPGHARKFAAQMARIGAPYLYYENTFGGHSNDADPTANAERWARHYVYLSQKLMD